MKNQLIIPTNVIINADDFGLNIKRNQAITKCFQKGLINSTSIMPNMPLFKEAIISAKDYNFQENIGLHACITEGKSLTDLSKTPFVDKEGFFIKRQVYKPTLFLSKSVRNLFEKEVVAQLEALKKSGIKPTHINTHHDIHELPWLLPIFLSISKKHQIKLRVSQIWIDGKNSLKPLYRKLVNGVYKYYNLNYTDYFETLDIYKKKRLQKTDPYKITEIMVHPDLDRSGRITDSLESGNLEKDILILFDQ